MKRWGRPVNFAAFVALTISIIAGIVDVNAAEMDLATVLVGRWEGELAQSKRGRGADPPERTLVINSVMKTDSGWIVDARYGITGRGLGRVEVTLDSTAGAPTLSFLTGANGRVTLRVFDDQNLTGLWAMGSSERAMKFRKEK